MTLLLLMLMVAVLRAGIPWLRIASNVPVVKPLVIVTVLFVMFDVKVPAAAAEV